MTEREWYESKDPNVLIRECVPKKMRSGEQVDACHRKLVLLGCALHRLVFGTKMYEDSVEIGFVEQYAEGGPAPVACERRLAEGARYASATRPRVWCNDLINLWSYVRVDKHPPSDAVRDVLGPFAEYAFDPAWVTPEVTRLAIAACGERTRTEKCFNPTCSVKCPPCGGTGKITVSGTLDPERLAVLSDALEEAGHPHQSGKKSIGDVIRSRRHPYRGVCCEAFYNTNPCICRCLEDAHSETVLDHLRGPGPHYKGCHALDLILGRPAWPKAKRKRRTRAG